jgi:hypothetical protein
MNKQKLGRAIFAFGLIVGFIPGLLSLLIGAIYGVCSMCFKAGCEITQNDYFSPIKKNQVE